MHAQVIRDEMSYLWFTLNASPKGIEEATMAKYKC